MDKRVAKRHKREVARAKRRTGKADSAGRTPEPAEGAREAGGSPAGSGRIAKLARAIHAKITGRKSAADQAKSR